jgi:integrase/recombinase XerD
MRQAQTLNEAQFRRVLHYCRSRRHPVRDTQSSWLAFMQACAPKKLRHLN